MFACWHAGLVAVPINAKLHPKELEFILGRQRRAPVLRHRRPLPGAGRALAFPAWTR
jgi:acyl-CoA synthetase (AMP-forming)/AMP-acid ligase II